MIGNVDNSQVLLMRCCVEGLGTTLLIGSLNVSELGLICHKQKLCTRFKFALNLPTRQGW